MLQGYDAAIQTASNGHDAWLSAASGTANGYTLTTTPGSGAKQFTITRSGGSVTRSCTPPQGAAGGCVNGHW